MSLIIPCNGKRDLILIKALRLLKLNFYCKIAVMRLSESKIKTKKRIEIEEESKGLAYLLRANFIEKLTSGVYNYLPFGLRVVRKIEKIVREEMERVGGQEILMAALHPKSLWEQTNRWEAFDALFKVQSRYGQWYGLGPTHEEVVTPLAKNFIFSYRDLPLYLYQIQTKFRDEPRPKGGLMRTKEFLMKDLYSFHTDEKDLDWYYEKVKKAYLKVYKRCGLKPIITEASGGTFSKFSHEFQVLTEKGEDTIFLCANCGFSRNKEIMEGKKCPVCGKKIESYSAAEVGNIFKLKDKYSRSLDLKYIDQNGEEKYVLMGCYGIGISRLLSVISEVLSDSKGLVFPEEIAPYHYIILPLYTGRRDTDKKITKFSEEIYQLLKNHQKEVVFDDRKNVSIGEKFNDVDLMGIFYRLVISEKTLSKKRIEVKKRNSPNLKYLSKNELVNLKK